MNNVLRTFRGLVFVQRIFKENRRTAKFIQRGFHYTNQCFDKPPKVEVVSVDSFNNVQEKTKKTFLDMLKMYKMEKYRSGNVEFINTAIKHLDDFAVNEDLETYKKIIQVLPAGKFVPQNYLQAEFMHYPKHQQCIIDLLQKMEDNGKMLYFKIVKFLLKLYFIE